MTQLLLEACKRFLFHLTKCLMNTADRIKTDTCITASMLKNIWQD